MLNDLIDVEGKKWRSLKEMAYAYDIKYKTLWTRYIKKQYPFSGEKPREKIMLRNNVFFKGVKYESAESLCGLLGVSTATLFRYKTGNKVDLPKSVIKRALKIGNKTKAQKELLSKGLKNG